MDIDLRRQMCRLVAGLVVSDDDLDEKEDALINRLLARFGIPPEERDSIFPIVDRSEAAAAIRELPIEAQREAFDLLVEAAVADGKVVAEEKAYLATVAAVLDISDDDVQARIKAALARG
jgi:uncharacterized tellurite resistance protein B-like protein